MRKITVAAVSAALGVVGIAGCGGGSSASSGSQSPVDVAKAFVAAVQTNNASDICKYINWTNTSSGGCVDNFSQALQDPKGKFSGNIAVGNSASSGNQAIVVTTGSFSFLGQSISNSDPNVGLPKNGQSFAQAYAAVSNNPNSPDLQLTKVNGKWLLSITG